MTDPAGHRVEVMSRRRRHEHQATRAPEGATIAVVAPSSPPQERSGIEQATQYLESRGYTLKFGPNHRKVHGYLAGTDEERAADIQWALSEPGIDMVFASTAATARAGCTSTSTGTSSVTRGSSAATATSPRCTSRSPSTATGHVLQPHVPALHAQEGRADPITEQTFHRAFRPEPLGRVPEDPDDPYVLTVGEGVAEAPIVGGCLTLVAASLGTPYEIQTDGCIVMLEDLNEDPYMIDAHLNHLIDAGKLANAAWPWCSGPT